MESEKHNIRVQVHFRFPVPWRWVVLLEPGQTSKSQWKKIIPFSCFLLHWDERSKHDTEQSRWGEMPTKFRRENHPHEEKNMWFCVEKCSSSNLASVSDGCIRMSVKLWSWMEESCHFCPQGALPLSVPHGAHVPAIPEFPVLWAQHRVWPAVGARGTAVYTPPT